jgi:hypothetical protein
MVGRVGVDMLVRAAMVRAAPLAGLLSLARMLFVVGAAAGMLAMAVLRLWLALRLPMMWMMMRFHQSVPPASEPAPNTNANRCG